MSHKKKKILSFLFSGVMIVFAILPFFTSAQGDTTTNNPDTTTNVGNIKMDIKIDNPFKQDTIKGLIETIVNNILMPIGGVVAVVMIMYAGFLFVTARGEPAKITKAKDALLYAVIGAAILLGAWVISQVIDKTISDLRNP